MLVCLCVFVKEDSVMCVCWSCSIVGERQIQRNFQLIVITHDDEFVDMLGRSKFVDDYYHVSKDEE